MGAYSMAAPDKENKPSGVAVLTTVVNGLVGIGSRGRVALIALLTI
jgi:hypothetical protein